MMCAVILAVIIPRNKAVPRYKLTTYNFFYNKFTAGIVVVVAIDIKSCGK